MKIEDAVLKYKFIRVGDDGVCEIFADHHMLSSLRQCEGYFDESILNNRRGNHRAWSLEFGSFIHESLEYFDDAENSKWNPSNIWSFPLGEDESVAYPHTVTNWIQVCKNLWFEKYKLEEFANIKQYKSMKGWPGAELLLLQYYTIYGDGRERLRTVGTELGFGLGKEVPVQTTPSEKYPFRAFLTGRLDRIVDNGQVIGPMDRKTTAYFDGSEGSDFKPHEGMQGYVYALQHLINAVTEGEAARMGRLCNSIIIDHISLRETKDERDRFKRSIKNYTPNEMEQWRLRQLSTFSRLYDIVINERTPDWNTAVCSYMFYHDCPYKALHEVDELQRPIVLNAFYKKAEPWVPYSRDEVKK